MSDPTRDPADPIERTPEPEAYARLDEATRRLRAVAPASDDAAPTLSRALRAPRRSGYVLAQAPGGPVRLARPIVVAALREAIDTVPGIATARIDLAVADRETLTGVTADVLTRYGTDLAAATDAVHRVAAIVLAELLGRPVAVHVRVVDVTVDDPTVSDR